MHIVCVLHLYHFFMCSGPAYRSPSEARSFRKGCPHPFQNRAWWCLAARTLGASHAPKGTSPPPRISPPPAPFPQSTEGHFNFDFGQQQGSHTSENFGHLSSGPPSQCQSSLLWPRPALFLGSATLFKILLINLFCLC